MKNKETLPQMINSIEKKSGKRFSSDFKRNVGLLAGASSSQSANVNSNVNSNTQNKAKIIVAGHEAVDLGLPSGTKWATCNLGATSPTAAGNAYAWGETSPKSYYTEKNYKYSGQRITTRLSGNTDAAYVNWGKKWRMPTMDDFKELERYCSFVWTGKGFDIIGKNGNKIFLPATGDISGKPDSRRDFCRYWLATNHNSTGYYLFGNRSSTLDYSFGIVPYTGMYIRPVTSDNGF